MPMWKGAMQDMYLSYELPECLSQSVIGMICGLGRRSRGHIRRWTGASAFCIRICLAHTFMLTEVVLDWLYVREILGQTLL